MGGEEGDGNEEVSRETEESESIRSPEIDWSHGEQRGEILVGNVGQGSRRLLGR